MAKPKIVIVAALAIIFAIGVGLMINNKLADYNREHKQRRTVFFGPEEYREGIVSASKNPRKYFDALEAGEELAKQGDYNGAIGYFKKSLQYISLEPQKATVYQKIADAYKSLGDMESELSAVLMVERFTKNDSVKVAYKQRADQIRQALAAPTPENK